MLDQRFLSGETWIVDDIVVRLAASLTTLGISFHASTTPIRGASAYFCFNYPKLRFHIKDFESRGIVHYYLTHIDTSDKHRLIEWYASLGFVGCAMSHETFRRVSEISKFPGRFRYVPPVSMLEAESSKFTLMVSSKVYGDGRKRERKLIKIAEEFTFHDLEFVIVGEGWESIITELRERGYQVDYRSHFVRTDYIELLKRASVLFYPGFDEGAISVLDALAVGTPVLCSAQGYHLEFSSFDGISLYSDDANMIEQLQRLISEHQRVMVQRESVCDWISYARELTLPSVSVAER